jgi:triosephosphate isomerase
MIMARRPLIAGNWKMNGASAALAEIETLAEAVRSGHDDADIVICPPSTLLMAATEVGEAAGIETGGQDCHASPSGAHTGDLSAEMLADAGAAWVIVGHSERRRDHGETDAMVRAKADAALRAGLSPIICVGETQAERDSGQALCVVAAQVAGAIPSDPRRRNWAMAYEPVWAIGSGRTPSLSEIQDMHAAIRGELARLGAPAGHIRLLYGGSVNPANARDILALRDVDGALVGGASLKAGDFLKIIQARGR